MYKFTLTWDVNDCPLIICQIILYLASVVWKQLNVLLTHRNTDLLLVKLSRKYITKQCSCTDKFHTRFPKFGSCRHVYYLGIVLSGILLPLYISRRAFSKFAILFGERFPYFLVRHNFSRCKNHNVYGHTNSFNSYWTMCADHSYMLFVDHIKEADSTELCPFLLM